MAQVPVEVFDIITSYLSRADVRNLRLVCREFEAKASGQYFRNVVVPFRSELYPSLRRDVDGSLVRTNPSLFSDGMRIFESFGPHVLRFALSLELDEDMLAHPPLKPAQEAVPTFWGIYRWPHENYRRYTDLANLEDTADETHGMKAALRCLTRVHTLGLSCDAGLGYLCGPDTRAPRGICRQPVFSTVNWRQQNRSSLMTYEPAITVANATSSTKDQKQSAQPLLTTFRKRILERMVTEAGYVTSQIEDAVQVLLDTEGVTLSDLRLEARSVASPNNVADPDRLDRLDRLDRPDRPEDQQVQDHGTPKDLATHALIPASLTQAQREMLLELEWAHRAMIQSFALAIVNNTFNDCFNNVTTFTVAKIPGCHLHIFCRDDVWKAISSLKNLSFAVIADWRQVMVTNPGCVEDVRVSPTASVSIVFQLLNNYVGKYRNIESIHFEWICGGEFGAGSHQRNTFILPAPFYHRAELMALATVVKRGTSKLLHLPYVKHLSLKNCWSPPHIFLQAVRQFALASLQKLELESVSLSGPPTGIPQASLRQPIVPSVNQESIMTAMALFDGEAPFSQDAYQAIADSDFNVLVQQQLAEPIWVSTTSNSQTSKDLDQPDLLSWAGLIDHFSPSVKVRDLVAKERGQPMDAGILASKAEAVQEYIPHVNTLHEDEKKYHLTTLCFRSCGYVTVDARFLNTAAILPHGHERLSVLTNKQFKYSMQTCKDKLLARISPFIGREEKAILKAFGMTFGWRPVYEQHVIDDARHEGVFRPGQDRFNGIIEAADEKDRAIYHEFV
ncbi:hypothetical protein E4U42_007341 [Claviceps africana]|uniref:F-box domain-containing protein n=1 Tax=Claviceps africana TaxID=83212 RepID=A0A8K0JGU9_9HYPO|nr:hypothetical protein E4U42_007341 [Claviceps africana]